jgi:hypothetical protein
MRNALALCGPRAKPRRQTHYRLHPRPPN